ncbi:sugar kinase [Erysipelothrix sp. HDW6C]|uniref:sugar kinase n=1 Tax=Erysipelothrix sp. HDW6C TaxID=2714930 RepID=UPI00140D93FE|nr:sugar kinase [Erysipelothrix sp. HDW6C]QIK69279.1 sugar kinase [Erysipelothrix sp. HDW6C]
MKKVITFGEIMLRLVPEGYNRFTQADRFLATYGGGEANVAVSLANFGIDAAFVTKLPTHAIGQSAVNDLRRYGVETRHITRGGDRVGIYFLEKGASQRASNVIYDRAHSAIAEASADDFDWETIFEGYDWFHFTGITPALGENVAAITLAALKEAKKQGLKVSCDLNYRKKLWTQAQAQETMSALMEYVDVLVANEEDSEKVFGIKAAETDVDLGEINHENYIDVAKQLQARFNFEKVTITLRESISASDNIWSTMLYVDGHAYFSKKYNVHIVDRVGGGDSFGSGLIYALLNDYSNQDAIEFATAASCLKHSIEGDYNRVSVDEVLALAKGDGSGRVQR